MWTGTTILLTFITVLLLCPLNDVYGMNGAYTPNYGAKGKSTAVNDEMYVLFKGVVQIKDGNKPIRPADKNEVVVKIFCGENSYNDGIFTESYGKFEVVMPTSYVQNHLEECQQGMLNIGFYRKDPSKFRNSVKKVALNDKDAKAKSVQRLFAKVDRFACLKLSDEFTEKGLEELEEKRENEKKEDINEFLNKQMTKQDDENSFLISFEPTYAEINGTEALLDNTERYRSYEMNHYFFDNHPPKSATSSSENKLVKKVAAFLGIKKKKPTHF
uniref:Uncharacterized protein n=1 Tax=Globodera pallida TaxID=36090 RepID=A0A183BX22_GLOPA